jgi:integrase
MTIIQRGKSWQASVTHAGKRIRVAFKTEQEARVWVTETELAILRGEAPGMPARVGGVYTGTQRTLRELHTVTHTTHWASLRTDASSSTGEKAVAELGEETAVSDVTYERIVAWVSKLRESGLTQATINRRLAALSTMLKVATEMRWIPERPKIPFGKEHKQERRYLTREEEALILKHLEGRLDWSVAVLAVETGLRRSEVLSLRWRDIGVDRVTVAMSKNGRSRTVPLTKRAKAVLSTLERSGSGPFAGMSPFEVSRRFRMAAEAAGVSDSAVVFHSLRHTCASRLVMAGVDIRRVQEWMGHRTIQSTMVYAHLAPTSLRDAVALIEAHTKTECLVGSDLEICGTIGVNVSRSADNIG